MKENGYTKKTDPAFVQTRGSTHFTPPCTRSYISFTITILKTRISRLIPIIDRHLDLNLWFLSREHQVCAKLIWYGRRATGKTRCIICSISIELRLSHFILIRFWRSQHYQICHWFIWCEHRTRSTLIIIIRTWIGTIGRCGKTFLIYVMELVLTRNSSYQKG